MTKRADHFDDSIEREFYVLAVQLTRVAQSFRALAEALATERGKRYPSPGMRGHSADDAKNQDGPEALPKILEDLF